MKRSYTMFSYTADGAGYPAVGEEDFEVHVEVYPPEPDVGISYAAGCIEKVVNRHGIDVQDDCDGEWMTRVQREADRRAEEIYNEAKY